VEERKWEVAETPDDNMDRFDRIAQSQTGHEKTVAPPKLKMDEWVGRKVALVRDLATRGGAKFPCGTVFTVEGHWRGKLHLYRNEPKPAAIRQVERAWVELLDEGTHGS
jgi:hypothetical protein